MWSSLICLNSYELPQRIHTSQVYPVRTPIGGLQIVICGLESGLRILWRANSSQKKPGQDVASQPKEDESIVYTRDISLRGAEALHLALPSLPATIHPRAASIPPLLSEKLVLAVACSDFSVRILTIPLNPPNPTSDLQRDIQAIVLSSNLGQKSLQNKLAITYTPRRNQDARTQDLVMYGRGDNSTVSLEQESVSSRPISRSDTGSGNTSDIEWDFLVASHSADLSGLLLVHRISLHNSGIIESGEATILCQTEILGSPAVCLRFSSALYPSPLHSRLLVGEGAGKVRVFDCASRTESPRGHWIASVPTPFDLQFSNILPRRTPLLDASWLLNGRAILLILSDGQCGLWELTPGISGRNNSLLQDENSPLGGDLEMLEPLSTRDLHTSSENAAKASNSQKSRLAPMTPATRKVRQEAFFSKAERVEEKHLTRGGVSVCVGRENIKDNETALLWYGTNITIVSNISKLRQRSAKGSRDFTRPGSRNDVRAVTGLQLCGERCKELVLSTALHPNQNQMQLLATADHRIVFIEPGPTRAEEEQDSEDDALRNSADETLLALGELDVDGMNRILDDMSTDHMSTLSNGSRDGPLLLA